MKQKGSMTIAMSLMLLALIAVTIRASQTACARVQSVNGIDTALYSLFSEYDKELLETYNLFFLDAGYGTGKLDIGQMISQAEHYAKPVLSSGMTRCSIQACGAEGFRLASDRKGKAVEQQIIRYMKGNLGAAGIEKLRKQNNPPAAGGDSGAGHGRNSSGKCCTHGRDFSRKQPSGDYKKFEKQWISGSGAACRYPGVRKSAAAGGSSFSQNHRNRSGRFCSDGCEKFCDG